MKISYMDGVKVKRSFLVNSWKLRHSTCVELEVGTVWMQLPDIWDALVTRLVNHLEVVFGDTSAVTSH